MLRQFNTKTVGYYSKLKEVAIALFSTKQWEEFKEDYLIPLREQIISKIKKGEEVEKNIGKLEAIDELLQENETIEKINKKIQIISNTTKK